MNNQELECNDTILGTEKKSVRKGCCGIYGLRNKITGKWYIGQSIDIYKRWNHAYERLHCKGQRKIYLSLKKYGYENFDKVILEECDSVDWILDYRETYWIRYLNSVSNGYNLREGGHCGKVSDETKKKISTYRKGRKWTDDERKKISISTKLSCGTDEFKKKISESWNTRIVSEDTKNKIRRAKLNQTEETRRKISEANKGRTHSEESKNKIRNARKEYWRKKKLDDNSI